MTDNQRYTDDLIAELCDEIAALKAALDVAMSENQRLTKIVEDYEQEANDEDLDDSGN